MKPHVRTIHTKTPTGGTSRTYLVPALPRHVLEANAQDMGRPLTLTRKETRRHAKRTR